MATPSIETRAGMTSFSTITGERFLAQGLARRGEAHDGAGIGIGLDDGELLHGLGELALDPADRLAHVARGGVEVDIG